MPRLLMLPLFFYVFLHLLRILPLLLQFCLPTHHLYADTTVDLHLVAYADDDLYLPLVFTLLRRMMFKL